jgi:hypothetical protein
MLEFVGSSKKLFLNYGFSFCHTAYYSNKNNGTDFTWKKN